MLKFRLAFNTAAINTTINSNVLYFSGYKLKNSTGKKIKNSNGIRVVETYNIEYLKCFKIRKTDFEVQVYDFFAHGITADYDDVIELNF